MHPALTKYVSEIPALWVDTNVRYMFAMAAWVKEIATSLGIQEAEDIDPLSCKYQPSIDHDTGHIIREIAIQLKDQIPKSCTHLIHYGCTSEDIMNLAEATELSLSVVAIADLLKDIDRTLPTTGSEVSIMGMTHGLPATPVKWAHLITHYKAQLGELILSAPDRPRIKWGGACGRKTAMKNGMPDVNWGAITTTFLTKMGYRESASSSKQIGTNIDRIDILLWFLKVCYLVESISIDFWHYISRGVVTYKSEADGSSAMPHKDNPTAFERAEGMARHASRILPGMARDKIVTRMQRDLSGMFVHREIPETLCYVEAACRSLQIGLNRLEFDGDVAREEIENNPQCISEIEKAISAANGVADNYEVIKGKYR